MRIVFRTDASLAIGTGHVCRCAVLATELAARGAEIHFICREEEGSLLSFLSEKNFSVHAISTNFKEDTKQTTAILKKLGDVDLLVVDHYKLDASWESALRPFVKKIMVIDDLADRKHDADFLLDQNYHHDLSKRYTDLIPETCRVFLGPHFALLAPEFLQTKKTPDHDGKNILVFFGGTDAEGLTLQTILALKNLSQDLKFSVQVIVGVLNQDCEKIRSLCKDFKQCKILEGFVSMPQAMSQANIFIGAGGVTTWERSFFGVPAIVVATADNQEKIAREFAEAGAQIYLGRENQVTQDDLMIAVKMLLKNKALQKQLEATARSAVDGRGLSRVATQLLPNRITFREATFNDSDLIYNWRNHPETRRYSLRSEPIDFHEHKKWFEGILAHRQKIILIGEMDKHSAGVVRLDFLEENAASISVYVVPGLHHQGLGTALIRAATTWTKKNYPDVKKIRAEILPENAASRRAFENADYKMHSLHYEKDVLS